MSLLITEEISRRVMTLFFIVDTSGSMSGQKISALNSSIREVLPIIEEISQKNADAEIKISCLEFNSGVNWMFDEPKNLTDFKWVDLNTGGLTALGAACIELNEKLSSKKFLKADTGSYAPLIILLSDGEPTDNFQNGLAKLNENKWFQHAIKVAIAIGNDCKRDTLKEFTGNNEAIVDVHNIEQLKMMIKIVTVTGSQIASTSTVNEDTKQDLVNKKIQEQKDSLLPEAGQDDDWD